MDKQRKVRMARFLRRENDQANRPQAVAGRELFIPLPEGRMRALFYAPAENAPAPLFVDLHGGAYIFGSPEEDDVFCLHLCRALNINVLSLDYPLAPENPYPAALEEIYSALLALMKMGAEWGFQPENLSLGGHSAGGGLAAGLCLMAKERKNLSIRCQVLDHPSLDMGGVLPGKNSYRDSLEVSPKLLEFAADCYAASEEYAADIRLTPGLADKRQLENLPPAVILSCERDSLRTEAESYAGRLKGAGVEASLLRLKNARHGCTLLEDETGAAGRAFIFENLSRHIGNME